MPPEWDCNCGGGNKKNNRGKERLEIIIDKRFSIHKFDYDWLIGKLIENEYILKENINFNLNMTDIESKYRLAYSYGYLMVLQQQITRILK